MNLFINNIKNGTLKEFASFEYTLHSHSPIFKCLDFFLLRLDIKRKTKDAPVWLLVYSLNNTANLCSRMNNYSKANDLLKEAMQKSDKKTLQTEELKALHITLLEK